MFIKFLKKILFSILVLIVLVVWNQFYLNASLSSPLKNDLTQKLKMISRDQPFIDFILGLSSQEKNMIDQMKIKSVNAFDHYGDLKNLRSEVASYIESLGNDKALSFQIALIISRVAKNTISSFNVDTAWITIRTFFGKNNDVPRWHTDGSYYESSNPQYKVAFVLKGPGTLFYNLPHKDRKTFNVMEMTASYHDSLELRSQLTQKLIDPSQIHQAQIGQGTVFVVGGDFAAVHSEPPIHSDRLFISIVPGTKKQIQELYDRRSSKH